MKTWHNLEGLEKARKENMTFSCLVFSTPAFFTVPYFRAPHFQSLRNICSIVAFIALGKGKGHLAPRCRMGEEQGRGGGKT